MHRLLKTGIVASAIGISLVSSSCSANEEEFDPKELQQLFTSASQERDAAECMANLGWNSTYDEESGLTYTEVPDSADEKYEKDRSSCRDQVGISIPDEMSDDDFQIVYSWNSAIASCLSQEGWDVPTKPDISSFIELHETEPWIPWELVPSEEIQIAREKCPVMMDYVH